MLTYTAGEDIEVAVPFERDGEPFVPDENTVAWALRGQDGALTGSFVSIDVSDTSALIPVLAASNSVATGMRFEKRTVVVRGERDGRPFEVRVPYQITPWLNYTASPEDVRNFCGAAGSELSDSDINLVDAYFRVADIVTEDGLEFALISGLAAEQNANRAIVAAAVLTALPGLRARMLKKEGDGNRTLERFNMDFDRLEADALKALKDATTSLSAIDDNTTAPPIFILTTPTDPVTGA